MTESAGLGGYRPCLKVLMGLTDPNKPDVADTLMWAPPPESPRPTMSGIGPAHKPETAPGGGRLSANPGLSGPTGLKAKRKLSWVQGWKNLTPTNGPRFWNAIGLGPCAGLNPTTLHPGCQGPLGALKIIVTRALRLFRGTILPHPWEAASTSI